MWQGDVNEAGALVLRGKSITVLIAGVGDASPYLADGPMDEEGLPVEALKRHLGVHEFVKKVELRLDKVKREGKNTLAGIARSAVDQAFGLATFSDLKCIPIARLCVTSQAQQQAWFLLEHSVKVVAETEGAILEEYDDERSDELELSFFVDSSNLRKAWLAATSINYAAFASRAQAEDPRFTDKVFATYLSVGEKKFKDIVACKVGEDTVTAWQLKTIEEKVRELRANQFAVLGQAIDALKRGRTGKCPDSAMDCDAPSDDGVEESAPSVRTGTAKNRRLQLNSEEKSWLKQRVGARFTEYKAASSDARSIICEEILVGAMETDGLRSNDWSLSSIKNQFHNFKA